MEKQMATPSSTLITVSSKGQIAIPKEFRAAAGLEVGAKVILECLPDGTLELHPLHYSIHEIFGVAKKLTRLKTNRSDNESILATIIAEDELTKRKGSA
jgi:AbrB family looped-hinge helix DNA binding protein